MNSFDRLHEIQKSLSKGELTFFDLVKNYLKRISEHKDLNAYIEVYEKEAISRAHQLQKRMDKGEELGKAYGMIVSVKDVICYAGHQVSAGSGMLENFTSTFSATVIERLIEEDAIIIGRTNCDEFAMGSDNTHSYYGPCLNPYGENRVPGGSSGGAAVSAAVNSCLVALGSDTGGSVRQPASFCNVIGFKPSYGRISRHGLIAYASSFDQIGFLSRDIVARQVTYDICQGKDDFDSTTLQEEVSSQPLGKQLKIGVIESALQHPSLQKEVKQVLQNFMLKLQQDGHEVQLVSFDLIDYLIPTYYILTSAEASSNLSRYDGIRYGHRAADYEDLKDLYVQSRKEGFGTEVKRRILLGTFVLSEGFFDAYYTKAQQVRRNIVQKIDEIFQSNDFLLMPTSPVTSWKLGEKKDPVDMYLADIFSVLPNLAGLPAASFPAGYDHQNLPVGLQIIGQKYQDQAVLNFIKSYSIS